MSLELIGLPGSGKTRLAHLLAQALDKRGVPSSEPQAPLGPLVPARLRLARKAAATGAAALAAPAATTRLTLGTLRSRQPGPADAAARLVQLLVAQGIAVKAARRPGVSIVDEGLVQSLWSIGLRGSVDPVLAALDQSPDGVCWSDILVVVQVSPDVALARLTARASQHSRTQLLNVHAGLAELQRGAKLLEELVDWWSTRPGTRGEVFVMAEPEETCDERELLVDHVCDLLRAAR